MENYCFHILSYPLKKKKEKSVLLTRFQWSCDIENRNCSDHCCVTGMFTLAKEGFHWMKVDSIKTLHIKKLVTDST